MALALRRGLVARVEDRDHAAIELTVKVDGEERPALAYRDLTGEVEPGDDVVVNFAARDLGLASGGFDVVHANLTRGLESSAKPRARTMKLNYTPLQHGVVPVEGSEAAPSDGKPRVPRIDGRPVAVLALHGQLAPAAWAAAQARPRARVGYVQSAGGALPGALSRTVRELRRRGLLAGHVTAAAAFGGEHEAVTVAGALVAAFDSLAWDAALVGPGPGIVGSGTALGHGGLAALDSAHASLALGARTLLVPRMSSGDPRARHRGLSHHSASVLELLLAPVRVAFPAEAQGDVTGCEALARHEVRRAPTELDGYRAADLPSETMGRPIDRDELFFRVALAGGSVLAEELTSDLKESGGV